MKARTLWIRVAIVAGALVVALFVGACVVYVEWESPVGSGSQNDEAKAAGRTPESFQHADVDYFREMDNGIQLRNDEAQGRDMWIVWTGGNDRFWDAMTVASLGVFDLLKIVTSDPNQTQGVGGAPYTRDSRWKWVGVVNEPCFEAPTAPDPDHFGLWLDKRRTDCPPDPFADATKFPGVKVGARGTSIGDGKTLPVGSFYGEPTGVVGLRLFPNPAFDEKSAKRWDAKRYYTDPGYYNDPGLVRPYRVGMSCGFCHVGPSPTHPPKDPAHPEWADLNSTVGAQYLWLDRVFSYDPDYTTGDSNFLDQLLRTYHPGTMDTSLVSTDYIDNPRTMNAVYRLGARMALAATWGKQILRGGELNNKQLDGTFVPPNTALSPHVLKDGSDGVGALGALNRVYLNIGLFSEEWLTHFLPFFGGKPISPIAIAVAEKNSVYWRATENGTTAMAHFLLAAGQPDRLESSLLKDAATIARGRLVFADTCARCHSSKLPAYAMALMPGGCAGPGYMQCWKAYWAETKTDKFKAEIRAIVADPTFLDGDAEKKIEPNYLSNDAWVPVTLLRTNLCSPLATNALANNIWNDFSSSTYKALPSVGDVTVQDPFTGEHARYTMPAGGRGYTRVPSLTSIWSTAPFFVNNRLGEDKDAHFDTDPSIEHRVKAFESAIHQLLWPESRPRTTLASGKTLDGIVDLTTERSWVKVPKSYLSPSLSWGLESSFNGWVPYHADANGHAVLDSTGHVDIGPIPKGTPVNLLANMQPLAETDSFGDRWSHAWKLLALAKQFKRDVAAPAEAQIDDGQFANLAKPLEALSKCPDYVVNRGHYFGTAQFNDVADLTDDEKAFGADVVLSDDQKNDLIAYLETL